MNARYSTGLSVLLLLGTSGCLFGPFYDDTIESTTTPVSFNLYSTQPGALMTGECSTHYSGFTQFLSKTASNSPSTLQGESIYSAQISKVIPASCWDYGFGKPVTWLRFFQKKDGTTYNVQVFNTTTGPACVSEHLSDGEGWLTAGWACRRTEGQQVRLFADH